MRITPQQLQIQLTNLKPTAKGEVSLKLGETFKAQVISILTDALVLQLSTGQTLRADVSELGRFAEGDHLEFQVVESEGQQVKVKLVPEKSEKVSVQVKMQLESVDLKPTEENIKAFEVLKSLDMNVTKSNVEALTKNVKMLQVLHDNVDKLLTTVVKTTDNPEVKALPVEMLSKTEFSPLKEIALALGYTSENEMKDADVKDVVVRLLNKTPETTADIKRMPSETIKEVFGLVRKALTQELNIQDAFEKTGQLLKMNKPVTIRSFTMLDKLTFEGEKIGDQVKMIFSQLEKADTSPKLLSLLKGFDIKLFTSDGEVKTFFNELMNELEGTKDQMSSRVKFSVEELMSSIRFIEKDQVEVSWIQIPIQLNQKTENLDLFFKNDKKEGKKLSKDNAKILIALNTENLDLVQALVGIKGGSLDVGFNVKSDPIKKLFEMNLGRLEETLNDEFTHINLHVTHKQPMTYSEFVYEDDAGHINMTV